MKKKVLTIQKEHAQVPHKFDEAPQEWIFRFWAWQALVWCLYRYFTMNAGIPETFEEFFVKPLVFVVPVLLFVLLKERKIQESRGAWVPKP